MVGMLAPEFEEVVTGDAEVREIFRVPRVGAIAGCYVQSTASSPAARRSASSARARSSGRARSRRCKRFKDDVREVQAGFECGIGLSDFQDLKPGDIIETFEEREIPRDRADDGRRACCAGRRPAPARRPLAEGEAVGGQADPRRRPAPVPGGGGRGRPPGPVAAGRARLRRRVRLGGATPSRCIDEVERFVWSFPEIEVVDDGTAVAGVTRRRRRPRPASQPASTRARRGSTSCCARSWPRSSSASTTSGSSW